MMTWVTLTIIYYFCFHIRCRQTVKYFIMDDYTQIHCNVCIYKPSPLEGNINPTHETLWILMIFSYRWGWMALMVKQQTINKLMAEQLAETKCHLCYIFVQLTFCEWRIRTNTVMGVRITFLPLAGQQTTICSLIFFCNSCFCWGILFYSCCCLFSRNHLCFSLTFGVNMWAMPSTAPFISKTRTRKQKSTTYGKRELKYIT